MADIYRNLLVNSYPTHSQTLAQVSSWDKAHQEMFLQQMQVLLDAANLTREINPADAADINWAFAEAYQDVLAKNRDLNIERFNALAEQATNIEQLQDAYEHTQMLASIAQEKLAESNQIRYGQKLDEFRQKKAGVRQYIWATMGDDKVRPEHAARDGQVFDWNSPPAGGHPGQDAGCRCTAVPASFFSSDASGVAEPVYPELLLPIFRALGLVRGLYNGGQEFYNQSRRVYNFRKPKGIPDDWITTPSNKDGGVKYIDPKNQGSYVRIMPPKPQSPYPVSRGYYIRWQRNGRHIDVEGNFTNNPEAYHIPRRDFKFKLEIFK